MRYDRTSDEYQINWEAFHEMDEVVPMTKPERDELRRWVKKGNDIESNPWNFIDSDGYPLNFLQAYRLQNGYSSGPWDFWKGPEYQPYWDDATKSFIPKDDFC